MTGKITDEDVRRSYELVALLEVCKGAAEHASEQLPPHHELMQLVGAIPSAIQQAIDKWNAVHDALEGAHDDGAAAAEKGPADA